MADSENRYISMMKVDALADGVSTLVVLVPADAQLTHVQIFEDSEVESGCLGGLASLTLEETEALQHMLAAARSVLLQRHHEQLAFAKEES